MEYPDTALLILLCPDSFLCLECAEGGCEYPDCDCACHHRLDNARAEARDWLRRRAQHTGPEPADASKRIAELHAALALAGEALAAFTKELEEDYHDYHDVDQMMLGKHWLVDAWEKAQSALGTIRRLAEEETQIENHEA